MDWKHSLMELMHQGGWVMWALLAFSILSLGTAIERALALRRANVDPAPLLTQLHDALLRRRSIAAALEICAAARGAHWQFAGKASSAFRDQEIKL